MKVSSCQRVVGMGFVALLSLVPSGLVCVADDGWALAPLSFSVPSAEGAAGVRNPIDAFVRQQLQAQDLDGSPRADRETLLRRVSLVVLGLPPSLAEREAFLKDTHPGAYERLIDRVLASPRFGERWAQHWLDVIRFAETWGFETNAFRERAYPYRNWLIEAFNQDIGFERFVLEQLAGDVVGVDPATGFLVAGPANLPGQIGKDIESQRQARQDELDEVVRTVSEGFWGLTVGCARCHDHKFDPISQRDYYSLQAVFSGLRYGHRRWRGEENDQWQRQLPDLEAELARLRRARLDFQSRWSLRDSLEPAGQTELFDPVVANAVRMVIGATANGGPASLHELEIWSKAGMNVALSAVGGTATASSYSLNANQTRHPENLIDGKSEFPWLAAAAGESWVMIELPQAARLKRVFWRQGGAAFPVDYVIEVRGADGAWVRVADSSDRLPHAQDFRSAEQIPLAGLDVKSVGEIVKLNQSVRATQARRNRLAAGPQVYAGFFESPESTYRLHHGDPMQRREEVSPDVPDRVGDLALGVETTEAERRVRLARLIAASDQPLAWRVMVNRVWQHYFGRGLVGTASDFGFRGERPSHPELLDWLVSRWQASGASFKDLHRLILLSATFQQRSEARSPAFAIDAETRLLWRFPPRLLEAEALRDAILAASGELNLTMYGEGFNFFHNKGGLADYRPKTVFGPEERRRMIYATKMRMTGVELFGAFNCPDAGQMISRRSEAITPIQSLNLFNGPFVYEQAQEMANQIRGAVGSDLGLQVERAVVTAFGRQPTTEEIAVLAELAKDHGLTAVCRVLFNTSDFVMVR